MKKPQANVFSNHRDQVARRLKMEQEKQMQAESEHEASELAKKLAWQQQSSSLNSTLDEQISSTLLNFGQSLGMGACSLTASNATGVLVLSLSFDSAEHSGKQLHCYAKYRFDAETQEWSPGTIDLNWSYQHNWLNTSFPKESDKLQHLLLLISELKLNAPEWSVELTLERVNRYVLQQQVFKWAHHEVRIDHRIQSQFFSVEGFVEYEVITANFW